MSIVEFLLARIAEDEAVARAAAESDPSKQGHYMDEGPAGNKWTTADGMVSGQSGDLWDCEGSNTLCTTPEVADHMARHDPARVLAECAAKRAIIGTYKLYCAYAGQEKLGEARRAEMRMHAMTVYENLRHLAAVYADHTDYDPDWAL